jgi:hypothetical protein
METSGREELLAAPAARAARSPYQPPVRRRLIPAPGAAASSRCSRAEVAAAASSRHPRATGVVESPTSLSALQPRK